MQCNDLKPRIKDKLLKFLHHSVTSFSSAHLWFFYSPLASNIQNITHHVPEEVEEALDDSKDMAYNPEAEDHEERHCRNDQ
jgi:hypothetical protein